MEKIALLGVLCVLCVGAGVSVSAQNEKRYL